ncbi:hypothetical protein DBR45_43585 [Pseudomonas sp. HMWF031]|jgi:hypothetical protein|nr:hypothetical protein DBR45_43585 [Pseudomonas sp. HMWF031]
MSVTGFLFSTRLLWLWSLLMVWLLTPQALAQDVSITALFKPDSAHPHLNKFTNTTPPSGYCKSHAQQCEGEDLFSLQVPIQFQSRSPILANHASERRGAMLKVPAQWRDLAVIHETTGDPQMVRIRIAGIGSRAVTDDVMELVGGAEDYRIAHNRLWGSSWVYAPSPCQYTGSGFYATNFYEFFWKAPMAQACSKQAKYDVPWLRFDYLDFAYELETPNPLKMASGLYSGSLTYTIGPNGDFDFGDVMLPSSPVLTMNFNLDVQHTLKVDVPPGGEKIQLVPAGGWQSWLQAGRKPVRLFRDQTFNISASSRFKMFLQCSITDGRVCYLADRNMMLTAPLKVSVSLPGGLTDNAGRPVQRQELLTEGGDVTFQPGHYVDRQPGTLHFELERPDHLFLPGAPKQYFGNVTVVWDSEV